MRIHYGYNIQKQNKINWNKTIERLEKLLCQWKQKTNPFCESADY